MIGLPRRRRYPEVRDFEENFQRPMPKRVEVREEGEEESVRRWIEMAKKRGGWKDNKAGRVKTVKKPWDKKKKKKTWREGLGESFHGSSAVGDTGLAVLMLLNVLRKKQRRKDDAMET
jgi:hypothetical protein